MQINRLLLAAVTAACWNSAARADEVTGLVSFQAGSPARASEVNGNFTAVKTAVDDNHTRLSTAEAALNVQASTLASHDDTLESLAESVSAQESALASRQQRVNGTCAVGSAISQINVDGSVICDANIVAGSVQISSMALQPTRADCSIQHRVDGSWAVGTATGCFMLAPLSLPDHVELVSLRCAVTDLTASSSLDVGVLREDLLTGGNGLFMVGTNASTTVGRQVIAANFGTINPSTNVVNNTDWRYYALIRTALPTLVSMDSIGEQLKFHGCNIAYKAVTP